jgi:hypothetical protein
MNFRISDLAPGWVYFPEAFVYW